MANFLLNNQPVNFLKINIGRHNSLDVYYLEYIYHMDIWAYSCVEFNGPNSSLLPQDY